MKDFELETIHRIRSNQGFFYQIGPDDDGLGMIDFKYFYDIRATEPAAEFTMNKDAIKLLIEVLNKVIA